MDSVAIPMFLDTFRKVVMSLTAIITLDVGGKTFRTTRSTLVSCPDSLLAKMFDPDSDRPPAMVTKGGGHFLDVGPRYLGIILNWLRHR